MHTTSKEIIGAARAHIIITEVLFSQCASYSSISSPIHSDINEEQYKKHHYNISSQYEKHGKVDRHNARLNCQSKSGCVAVPFTPSCIEGAASRCKKFLARKSVRNASASNIATKSHTEALSSVPQIVTYAEWRKEWVTKENKGNFW